MIKNVLFFSDMGVDDAVALMYASFTKTINIVGIVCSYGNVPVDDAVQNAHFLIHSLGLNGVPVIKGAERPMTGEIPTYSTQVHGTHGLGSIVPPFAPEGQNFGIVKSILKRYRGELIIVDVGRLTSLAMAMMLYGDLIKKVKGYYIMGGAFLVPGNVTPVAEANFAGDPVAAELVMRHGGPISLFPLNVTNKAIVTPSMSDSINWVGKVPLFKPIFDFYYNFYKTSRPQLQGAPIHDLLPVMALVNRDMFQWVSRPALVVTQEGIARGQSIADFRPNATAQPNAIRIALDLDYRQFYWSFMTNMTDKKG
ncbi:nucleoside hydrolase [Paenibacillus frigoriresistens]|uniref:nucleoside hydrolase n=1 Tax=Paenibacillus alginolyticus TaxID=59839 RepID=UPI0015674579|nr:nucleoside hydrolase [Paenibacillus frigoriresistens]NRF93436.1 nucleoside hydrolase [Paenibacillus frigoriresistens]